MAAGRSPPEHLPHTSTQVSPPLPHFLTPPGPAGPTCMGSTLGALCEKPMRCAPGGRCRVTGPLMTWRQRAEREGTSRKTAGTERPSLQQPAPHAPPSHPTHCNAKNGTAAAAPCQHLAMPARRVLPCCRPDPPRPALPPAPHLEQLVGAVCGPDAQLLQQLHHQPAEPLEGARQPDLRSAGAAAAAAEHPGSA